MGQCRRKGEKQCCEGLSEAYRSRATMQVGYLGVYSLESPEERGRRGGLAEAPEKEKRISNAGDCCVGNVMNAWVARSAAQGQTVSECQYS